MKQCHAELIKEASHALKILEYSNDIESVRRKIPSRVYDNYLAYFKKFKMILRHVYYQLD
eukprot:CAMPEP_0202978580 /NCGR_PEP_ID=MMETSP1396-20130829/84951_1 /ASSEMBLY_ACC=CAM_ASM_000872 /TAXON_ID= /ORGANISM="Pseudokeronopsis sp., Strain Brazil" /LENGTH=59 /DNA_ID=CAMNT_0049717591 /DNA_START=1556 /DNA_END=1735 /DNA_ORIENTATION=-